MSIFGALFKSWLSSSSKAADTAPSLLPAEEPDINSLDLTFGYQKLKRCRYGWMLYSGKYIGRCFDLYGEYSEAEIEIFRRCLRPGDVVVDVGANIGDLTVPISQIVGESGRVYAYESHPEVFNTLCANLALNQVRNVKPANVFVACSSEVETGSKKWGENAFLGDIWAPVFTSLDKLNLSSCRMIKIDVDGNELEVLKSAEETIARHRPILYFENDFKEKSRELLSYVAERGYRMWFHSAPIFQEQNFFGNPQNVWAPIEICSFMVLALPPGVEINTEELEPVTSSDDWWKEI